MLPRIQVVSSPRRQNCAAWGSKSARLITALSVLAVLSLPLASPSATPGYVVDLQTSPGVLRERAPVQLEITVRDAASGAPVKELLSTHEAIFHLYIVSEDLRYFAHEHPHRDADGALRLETSLPHGGVYRLLSEYQPAGAATQFSEGSLLVSNSATPITSPAPAEPRTATAVAGPTVLVSLRTEPSPPQTGIKTPLIFTLRPAEGLEKFHGDWGQLLVVSDDLIDVIRAEPAFVNAGQMQFNVYFPRPRRYRLWMEYRHSGVLHRERLDLDVEELR